MKAPYRHIPISAFIHEPEWKDQVRIDQPLADGVSGWLDIELTARTDLMIGGEQTELVRDGANAEFYTEGGVYTVPGATLRGRLRSVLEIAAFGRAAFLDDIRYALRSLQGATANIYGKRLAAAIVEAGWLLPEDAATGEVRIRPCEWALVHVRDVAQLLRKQPEAWNKVLPAHERYAVGGYDPANPGEVDAWVKDETPKRAWASSASDQGATREKGKLVFTHKPVAGQVAQKGKKNHEFFFYGDKFGDEKTVEKAWAEFLLVNTWDEDKSREQASRRPGWSFWKDLHKAEKNVPVFYIVDANGKIDALGTALMFRVAHELSTHQLLAANSRLPKEGRTSLLKNAAKAAHTDPEVKDFATLMFGPQLDGKTKVSAFKGRVSVEAARLIGEPQFGQQCSAVLSTPRGSYFPSMVRQPGREGKLVGDTYASYTSTESRLEEVAHPELAGRKVYPSRGSVVRTVPGPQEMTTSFQPLKAGTQFAGRVRFDNLKPEELGALVFALELWVDEWGERPDLRHRLGMGKPLGLGDVRIDITSVRLEPNLIKTPGERPAREWKDEASITEVLRGYTNRFADHMTTAFNSARMPSSKSEWKSSEQVELLLAISDPVFGEGIDLTYMALPDFGQAKNNKEILPHYPRRSATFTGANPGSESDRAVFGRPWEMAPGTGSPHYSRPTARSPVRGHGGGRQALPKTRAPQPAGRRVIDDNDELCLDVGPDPARHGNRLVRYADGEERSIPEHLLKEESPR